MAVRRKEILFGRFWDIEVQMNPWIGCIKLSLEVTRHVQSKKKYARYPLFLTSKNDLIFFLLHLQRYSGWFIALLPSSSMKMECSNVRLRVTNRDQTLTTRKSCFLPSNTFQLPDFFWLPLFVFFAQLQNIIILKR